MLCLEESRDLLHGAFLGKTQLIEQTKHNTWTGVCKAILRSNMKWDSGLADILYRILYIEGNPSKLAVSQKRAYDFLGICKAPIRS